MTDSRRKRLYDLWEEVDSLPPDQRQQRLEELRAHDPTLTSEVERLLSHECSSEEFRQSLAASARRVQSAPLRTGTAVGRYLVEDRIGGGASGDVYSGVNQLTEQPVALKFLAVVGDGQIGHEELQREARALGRLTHPNIARLYGIERAEDGTPVIVMERVDGRPLNEYVADAIPSFKERIRLFRSICSAVEAAHASLIVHSDLKPENILVDDHNRPKLVDFGIALYLEEHAQHARGMTLQYASPEQVEGKQIDARSDVYSLAVILYELVTGTRPYTAEDRESLREAILNEQPKPASLFLRGRERGSGETNSACLPPRGLVADLDLILCHALEKDPARRYQRIRDLSDDLQNLLDHRPVSAHRPSLRYAARKFVRRHPLGVSISIAAFVFLATFAVVTKVQAHRIAVERNKAAEVEAFLTDLFHRADPTEPQNRDLTIREILDTGVRKLTTEDPNIDPEVQAYLLATIGNVETTLGFFDLAKPILRKALALDRDLSGNGSLETARVLDVLGMLYVYRNNLRAGQTALSEALAIRERRLGPNDPVVATTLNNLALAFEQQGLYDQALTRLDRALKIRSSLGLDDADTLQILANIGRVLRKMGEFKEAEPYLRRALAAQVRLFGDDDLRVASTKNNLGELLVKLGRYDEAKAILTDALAVRRKVLGPENIAVAATISNLGLASFHLHNFVEAKDQFQESLRIFEMQTPPNPAEAIVRMNLGVTLLTLGDLDSAEKLLEHSLRRFTAAFGPRYPLIGHARRSLATIHYKQGKVLAAEAEFRQAVAFDSEVLGPDHPTTAEATHGLAKILYNQRRYREAIPLLRDALESRRHHFPPDHPLLLESLLVTAQALLESGDPASARPLLAERQAILEHQSPGDASNLAYTDCLLAICDARLEPDPQLTTHLGCCLEAIKAMSKTKPISSRRALTEVISLLSKSGHDKEAAPYRQLISSLGAETN